MGWPSREDLIREMGMDDTNSQDASYLQDMLATLRWQRESNPDEKDVEGERTGFSHAFISMYRYTFHTFTEPYYDRRRKCLWYLGWRVSRRINWCSVLTETGTKRTRIPRARDSEDVLHHARKPLSLRVRRSKTTIETDREIRHVKPRTQTGIC